MTIGKERTILIIGVESQSKTHYLYVKKKDQPLTCPEELAAFLVSCLAMEHMNSCSSDKVSCYEIVNKKRTSGHFITRMFSKSSGIRTIHLIIYVYNRQKVRVEKSDKVIKLFLKIFKNFKKIFGPHSAFKKLKKINFF